MLAMNTTPISHDLTTCIPQILLDIVEYLKEFTINISEDIEGEGRGGSLKDEGTVINILLQSKFKNYIFDEKARKFGDMIVLDYDKITRHPVNIKTTKGSVDNSFSKAGIVYAFTNLSDTSKDLGPMNLKKMHKLIQEFSEDIPKKDYWYLCINKSNPSDIIIRGLKQINSWVVNINPSNILQIDWKKEKLLLPANRSYKDSLNIIESCIKESIKGYINNIPEEWKNP